MVEIFRNSPYYKVQRFIKNNYSEYEKSFDDSISDDQYESKKWMCDILNDLKITSPDNIKKYTKDSSESIRFPHGHPDWDYPLLIEIIGSWFGWPLIELIDRFTRGRITQIDLYDPDEVCQKVTAQYKNIFNPKYKVIQHDNYFERKELRRRHLIICTSCEHMQDFTNQFSFKGNPFVCLQSNDYIDLTDHINCVKDVEELTEKNQIKNIWYKGEKDFGNYKRFMVIGQWQ
tara:strand:- start:677 stop:1369 length:693 start_codon:yes stop_codon:yes gene_type:complete